MRVLITGAAGFIGSHLAERLDESGHAVFGIDNLETGRTGNCLLGFDRIVDDLSVNLCFDISDRHALYVFANWVKPELVIHCAASYSDPDKWHRDVDTNISGTINIINAARHHGAKLVYFQTALPPISSYAISKIAAEHYIRLSEVPALTFRLSNIYGPRNVSGPIPAFYKRLAAGERCTVVRTARDMVYIADLVECVMKAVNEDEVGTYDVCSGIPVAIETLFEEVATHFPGVSSPDHVPLSDDDVMPQTSANEWLPGWGPKTQLSEGIARAVEWYRENGVGETFTHLRIEEKHGRPKAAA